MKVHFVLKDSKDQEGKWKENWISTNKMLKAVPCNLDYIRQRLANSRRLSVRTDHTRTGAWLCALSLHSLNKGWGLSGLTWRELQNSLLSENIKTKVQNKGYTFNIEKRKMNIYFIDLHKNFVSIQETNTIFPHGTRCPWGC